ncbi:YqaA family protein [Terriglobus tenax]|uniref:YqaA family protein n=1 Tax=Terriglobus tenax TaxID=1111115 RepID=UPI0021E08854|nr:VTT domain-containing protein [Terriglobus tenax]
MKSSPSVLIKKFSAWLLKLLLPLGFWGIGALALIDSATIPVPIDALLIAYVVNDHRKAFLYVLLAAAGSAVGSLVPFYVGRAGGELFLLKRINRKRYEQLRDRFERQEFFAIMIPAMMPPPTPIKLFEFAAGVFEMHTATFFLAIFLGKFLRFGVEAAITVYYGPQIIDVASVMIHQHLGYVWSIVGILLLVIGLWIMRKLFNRRKGETFPAEDTSPEN